MKKLTLILLISVGIFSLLKSQTVDSIKVEQSGELIKIHYKILNSNLYQTFKVTVSAKINGGLESKLESLIGDVGDAVKGGKDNYIVIWDVLKDVDEVKSADFSIKAELLSDNTPENNKKANWDSKKTYVMVSFGQAQDKSTFGIRLAYMGSWGVSGKFLMRKFGEGPTGSITLFHTGIDLTKKIVNKGGFSMHLMAGFDYGKILKDDNWDFLSNATGFEIGTIVAIKRLAISFAMTSFKEAGSLLFNPGIGIRF